MQPESLSTPVDEQQLAGPTAHGPVAEQEPAAQTHPSAWARLRRTRLARSFSGDPLNACGVVIVVAVIALAILGPPLAPYSPTVPDYNSMMSAPTWAHPFGTDFIGDDILSRVLAGARLSLGAAAAVLSLSVSIGLVLGAVAGFAGGLVDEVIMRVTDMFLAFPTLILALAVATTLGSGLGSAIVALGISFWPIYARLLRGQVLSVKGRDFVEAGRALGASPLGLMRRHILPNALTAIVIQVSIDMGGALLAVSSLSFIGLGAQPPSPEWGAMIAAGQEYLRSAWWIGVSPGLAVTVAVLGFNLTGDWLRDALDPRAG